LDDPAVQLHTVSHIHLEELLRTFAEGCDFLLERLVLHQHPHRLMGRQSDQVYRRRSAEFRVVMKGVASVGTDVVAVSAGLSGRSYPFRLTLAVQPPPVEVTLSGILGRRDVVEPPSRGINRHFAVTQDVKGARREQTLALSVPRDRVDVFPAVLLTGPEKTLSTLEPGLVVVDIHPGAVGVDHYPTYLPGLPAGEPDRVRGLQPVELLDDDLIRVRRPVHAGDVVVARIAGHLEPADGAASGAHHRNPGRRVRL